MAKWPEYFQVAEAPNGEIMGYSKSFITFLIMNYAYIQLIPFHNFFVVMGKAEGHGSNWHGHVTALTVAPCYRRLGIAALLMNWLEDVSEK